MNKPEKLSSDDGLAKGPVFISYATADRKEALSVCKAIERRGTTCWISCRDVEPGENYQEAIVAAIQKSCAMVLVFSEAANNSNEIKKELSLASRFNLTVIALRIEDVEPSNAFAYELSTRQWIDAFGSWDKSLDSLVRKIKQAGGSPTAPNATTSTTRRRHFTIRGSVLVAGCALVIVVAAVAGWLVLRQSAGPAHSMQVRLTGFSSLSPELPPTLPAALNEEISAAFNDDGVIGVSTAAAPPAGSGPAYALGGTVARDGNKLKVIVRMTDERTGTSLWSNSYSYESANLAHVARWAGVDVSQVVRCGLFGASTYPKPLADPILSDYLQFCVHASPTKDMDITHKIVAALPDFSWGWSGLAFAASAAAYQQPKGPKRDDVLKEARTAADRAIALDPSNSEAFLVRSHLLDPSDLLGRESLLKKAISARALACGCEHHEYGSFLMEVGRVDDAMRELDRSTDVLPLNPGSQFAAGKAMLIKGDPDAAAKRFDVVLDLADVPGLADNLTVTKAAITGKNAGADKAMLNPKFGIFAQNVRANSDAFAALDSANPEAKARAVSELNALKESWISMPEVPLLAALGDNADAIKNVDANVQRGSSTGREWLWYPSMDAVRRDPSFPALLQRLGLIHYWKTTHTKPDVCADKNSPPFCQML
ncbi:MAG TPA: TIR domain-containing protein [Sphingomicrobium sp.]|nr:TIR domain-containing protein [Sphingomicrobium sp.]